MFSKFEAFLIDEPLKKCKIVGNCSKILQISSRLKKLSHNENEIIDPSSNCSNCSNFVECFEITRKLFC